MFKKIHFCIDAFSIKSYIVNILGNLAFQVDKKYRKIISVAIVCKYPPKQHIQNGTKYLLPIFFYNPGKLVKVTKITKFARMINDTIFLLI